MKKAPNPSPPDIRAKPPPPPAPPRIARFPDWKPPKIEHGKPTIYGWTVWRPEKFTLGKNTDIGTLTNIFAHNGVEIWDEVQIGAACLIYSLNTIDDTSGKVTICKGAKIGAQSIILPGVTIGEYAKIGAQSLVKEDVSENEVVYGTPARNRKLKNRKSLYGRE